AVTEEAYNSAKQFETVYDYHDELDISARDQITSRIVYPSKSAVTEEAYNSAKQFETVYDYHDELDISARDQITSRIVYPSKSVHHMASIEDLRTWHSPANMCTLIDSSTARNPTLARHAGF
ncbi:hypothetical protein C0991_009375, partial [Blastosporella zonata]